MEDPFAKLEEALAAARVAWAGVDAAENCDDGLTGSALVHLSQRLTAVGRLVDALQVDVAARISRASRPELGNAGLARQQGFRSPASLLAATSGSSTADAARRISVGEAICERMTLTGASAPARHPFVAAAVGSGGISVDAAAAIIAMLDRVTFRAGAAETERAERSIVEQSGGLSLAQVHVLLQRAEAWLDPDGVEPRESELREGRAVHVREDRSGAIHLTAVLDPETAAPVVTVLDAMVGVEIRRQSQSSNRHLDAALDTSGVAGEDRRTVPQMRADALAAICRHMLGCADADQPTGGAAVVVRIRLEDLESGRGSGSIDGLAQPVSVATVRRMAAATGVIPWVLGGEGEILDFGRSRRLFSPAQKLALVERDGGCAMCGAPPGMTQVHHLRWWRRDAGPTDLQNGVLLCVRCHHRIHDDGWSISVDGAGIGGKVWFTPPAHVDATRTPRLGGRARYDYLAA